MGYLFIIFAVLAVAGAVWLIGFWIDSHKEYSDNKLEVIRINCEQDNSYYFTIRLLSWQRKKRALLTSKYCQNTVIYCKEDDSFHRVMRWGANVDGWQRIIAEPYIIESRYVINNYYIIANQASVCVEHANMESLNALYQELDMNFLEMDLEKKKTLLDTINGLRNRKVVGKKTLEPLRKFLESHADMFSAMSDVLSIIATITEMIKR